MIPAMNIIAWSQTVPWVEQRQVEQDLLISRALVELFNEPFLRAELRFRGGTALNKLHFARPLRYSEDIDLVLVTPGPIGPVIGAIRDVLEPWLGPARYTPSAVAPKLLFRVAAEDRTSPAPIRLKVEINAGETIAYGPVLSMPYRVENPWFNGRAAVTTYSIEELLATKLRALLQRNKGRDLIDLAHARKTFAGLDVDLVVAFLCRYLAAGDEAISRAQAEERMFAKLDDPRFLADVMPLLAADERQKFGREAAEAAFETVFCDFIKRLPGRPWARSPDLAARLGLASLAA